MPCNFGLPPRYPVAVDFRSEVEIDLTAVSGALPRCLNFLWYCLGLPRVRVEQEPWVYFWVEKAK